MKFFFGKVFTIFENNDDTYSHRFVFLGDLRFES